MHLQTEFTFKMLEKLFGMSVISLATDVTPTSFSWVMITLTADQMVLGGSASQLVRVGILFNCVSGASI